MDFRGGQRPGDTHRRTVHHALSSRAIFAVLVSTTLAAGTAGAVSSYQEFVSMLADVRANLAPGFTFEYVVGPGDYLPPAASLASLTLLSTAVGIQIWGGRLWRALLALSTITAVLLVFDLEATLVGVSPVLAALSIWAGPAVAWCFARWPGGDRRGLGARPPVGAPPSSLATPQQLAQGDTLRATRRLVTAAVVAAVAVLALLMVVSILGGLQMYFLRYRPDLDLLTYSPQALLAVLATWAGWLAGRPLAGSHARTWLASALVGVVLAAVDPLASSAPGSLAAPVLTTCAVVLLASRERLSVRATGAVSV